jgi:hypothetical protein
VGGLEAAGEESPFHRLEKALFYFFKAANVNAAVVARSTAGFWSGFTTTLTAPSGIKRALR